MMISRQQKSQIVGDLDKVAEASPSKILPTEEVIREHPNLLLRRKNLEGMLVYAIIGRMLAQNEQLRLEEESHRVQLSQSISDPFLRGCMQRRFHNKQPVPGSFYTAIEPLKAEQRQQRQTNQLAAQVHKELGEWLMQRRYRRAKKKKVTTIVPKRSSNRYSSCERVSIDESTLLPVQKPEPQNQPNLALDSLVSIQEKAGSKTPTSLFNRRHNHRSLDLDLKNFQELNGQVNRITQKKPQSEFVAVRHCVTSALSHAAQFKNDLLQLQQYQSFISQDERLHLSDTIVTVQEAMMAINQIIIGRTQSGKTDVRQSTRKIKSLAHSNSVLSVKQRSGYRISSYRTNGVSDNTMIGLTKQFSRLHKQFVRNCEKFFSHECNRVPIRNDLYQQLLQFASVARYRLMYLHRDAQMLFQKYGHTYWRTATRRQTTPHEKHVAHMTKVLTEKYNIAGRSKGKEQPPVYYFSQPDSPKRQERHSMKSKEDMRQIKRLIRKFRANGLSSLANQNSSIR